MEKYVATPLFIKTLFENKFFSWLGFGSTAIVSHPLFLLLSFCGRPSCHKSSLRHGTAYSTVAIVKAPQATAAERANI